MMFSMKAVAGARKHTGSIRRGEVRRVLRDQQTMLFDDEWQGIKL